MSSAYFSETSPTVIYDYIERAFQELVESIDDLKGIKDQGTCKILKDVILRGLELDFELFEKEYGKITTPEEKRFFYGEMFNERNIKAHAGIKFKLYRYNTCIPFNQFPKENSEPMSTVKKSQSHFGSMFVFPPAYISPFTGGDFITYNENGKRVLKTSELDQWTVVMTGLKVKYNYLPVTRGSYFIFKGDLIIPDDKYFEDEPVPDEQVKNVSYIQKKLKRLQKEKAKLEAKILAIQNNIASSQEDVFRIQMLLPTNKIADILSKINTESFVILCTNIISTNPSYLQGEDALLWNMVISKWPESHLMIFDASHQKSKSCIELEYEDETSLHLVDPRDKNLKYHKLWNDSINDYIFVSKFKVVVLYVYKDS